MNERDDRGLIYLVLKKLNLMNKYEDYYDVGLVGLAKAIKTYNPERGIKRSTYYVACIKYEIYRELYLERLDKRAGRKNEVSLNIYVDKETKEDELIDFIADEKKDTEKDAILEIQKEDLKYCIDNFLTKRQKEIIKAHYFNEIPVEELARKYKVTPQVIYAHMQSAYKKLRPKMLKIEKIKEEKEREETHERRRKREDKSLEELFGF